VVSVEMMPRRMDSGLRRNDTRWVVVRRCGGGM